MNNIYRKLAKANIKNNRQLYIPYIASGVITVMMFYLMMFLNNNPGLEHIPGGRNLKLILGLGVGVIAIFAYIFIFYTNSFISKRRKKEIGIYNILGMEKRHIAKVMALETIYVGCIAIAGGLAAGIVFSKLSMMCLYRILNLKESVIFMVTGAGIGYTLLVFGILYLLTLVYNLMQITLANPIELLRGSSVGEKEPKTKWFMAVAGAICIAAAYYIAITTENPLNVLGLFFIAVLLVIAGTYMLFTAGSIAVLKMLRKNKKFYYHKRHFTAVSGMLYRMKQNAAGLASICVLSTMVLIILSTTISMYAGIDDELTARYPSELSVYSGYEGVPDDNSGLTEQINDVIEAQGRTIRHETSYTYLLLFLKNEGISFVPAKSINMDGTFSLVNILTRDSLIAMDDDFNEDNVAQPEAGSVNIYSDRDYDGTTITILGTTYPVGENKVRASAQDMYMGNGLASNMYVVVDSLDTIREIQKQAKEAELPSSTVLSVCGYDLDGNSNEKIACAEAVNAVIAKQNEKDGLSGSEEAVGTDGLVERYVESRASNEAEFYAYYGGLFFLGVFLGIMFLMVTVMIIFYKQISEGYDDKDRYEIMEKVGMSNEEVKASIQSQIRMVFFLPLVTAAVHVAAAFPMVSRLLALMNLNNTKLFVICLIITLWIFTAIYYIVFKITSRTYYKIVGNQVR